MAQWPCIRCKHNVRWRYLSRMKDVSFWEMKTFLRREKRSRLTSESSNGIYSWSSSINRIIEGLDQEIGFSKQSHFCLIAKQIKTGHSGGLLSNHRGKKPNQPQGPRNWRKRVKNNNEPFNWRLDLRVNYFCRQRWCRPFFCSANKLANKRWLGDHLSADTIAFL